MKNEFKIFKFLDRKEVLAYVSWDGDVYFRLDDVCGALRINKPDASKRSLGFGETQKLTIPGEKEKSWFVNCAGIINLANIKRDGSTCRRTIVRFIIWYTRWRLNGFQSESGHQTQAVPIDQQQVKKAGVKPGV